VPELEYVLNDCQPRLLIYETEFQETAAALEESMDLEHLLVLGDPRQGRNQLSYQEALQSNKTAPPIDPKLTYNEIWAIIYTSGTTGRPKGAQVTYGNFFYNAVGMGQAIDLTSRDVNLNVLPTFHIGGLGLYACPTFHAGGTVVVMRSFDPGKFLALIEEYQVTAFLLVPSIYLILEDYPDFDQFDLSSVRSWASGGSPLPAALVRRYTQKGIIIQQGFGMTETGPTVFIISKKDAVCKAGSVGKPVLHTEVSIQDRQGSILGPNQVGELCIRGGNVTTGYWNRPEATREALRGGWLHSGDAAKYDQEGFYTIVDRWKDMYISGGENVYPAEVESVIYQHPAVAEAAVIGVPHPRWQEVGKAVVVIKDGHSLNEEELIEFCRGKLAKYKIPRSAVLVEALPRTAAGKVLKRELQKEYGG
jgi:fatty-acyl-CoA synthase